MTGWNMPPGCNVSDIPGNRPEDLADEALYEQVGLEVDALGLGLDDDASEKIIELIIRKMGEANRAGWQQAIQEQKMYEEMMATEKEAKEAGY